MAAHPDLKTILAQADFLTRLAQQQKSLADMVRHLADMARELSQLAGQQTFFEQQIADVVALVETGFDAQQVETEISDTQTRRDALVIDTQIDQKIGQAERDQQQFAAEQQTLNNQRANAEGRISSAQDDRASLEKRLQQLQDQGQLVLQTLAPYVPADATLTTIID